MKSDAVTVSAVVILGVIAVVAMYVFSIEVAKAIALSAIGVIAAIMGVPPVVKSLRNKQPGRNNWK